MPKITPNLWFDNRAEEAARFYVSLFENSKIGQITHYNEASSKAGKMPVGSVMTVTFEIDGEEFVALNGGPIFKFSEAVSFIVKCKSQEEVDRFWTKLTENGGEPGPCGWLKDKFGLSWQIVPEELPKLLGDSKEKAEAVTAALMDMQKIDLPKLQEAFKAA